MKSLFADFLQNVTPPGAFKRGYKVDCDMSYCGDGLDQAVGDLVLPHVLDNVKLGRTRLRDRHVCYLLQLTYTQSNIS